MNTLISVHAHDTSEEMLLDLNLVVSAKAITDAPSDCTEIRLQNGDTLVVAEALHELVELSR